MGVPGLGARKNKLAVGKADVQLSGKRSGQKLMGNSRQTYLYSRRLKGEIRRKGISGEREHCRDAPKKRTDLHHISTVIMGEK